ncbi:MAG TPA: helix-turn-helix transcriptional regulator [Thermoanaerobaculia bacterium]|jgi:transcriptional regulator with XRE-family HTH domain|nr:helix-turn-helix transcriptional regulator [Thermoanaerobaculia bacterium]
MMDKGLTTYEEMELEDARGLRQEELIIEVTEALARALRSSGLTQSELAARLGKTKGFVSQIMGGGNNLTLRTLADVAGAIGCRVQVKLVSEKKGSVALQRSSSVSQERRRKIS